MGEMPSDQCWGGSMEMRAFQAALHWCSRGRPGSGAVAAAHLSQPGPVPACVLTGTICKGMVPTRVYPVWEEAEDGSDAEGETHWHRR